MSHPNQIHNERRTPKSKDSKFDDDGHDIEQRSTDVLWNRYFETSPGSVAARVALDQVLETRR